MGLLDRLRKKIQDLADVQGRPGMPSSGTEARRGPIANSTPGMRFARYRLQIQTQPLRQDDETRGPVWQ
jgi:hypothetical protein